ncbi:hypothetical protein DWX10_16900 [Clostridium sp. AF18-27]|uniref:hypothetical protein n=1 Tax=Enterocloster lavalensis TaxID=460384 RepID=UPI000E4A5752|nr:hypothetical protein [Enterocloster lavalensis]MBS5604564.1 hypothetical protein [Enterocloster asparagiformis]RHR52090.1 hypothetical protein DWX10_16900 [Clostridium sp. AF18-27]
MMKAKEYRESIANGMRRVRRLYDLDLIFRIIELIRKMNASEELDRSVTQWILIRRVLSDDTATSDLDHVSNFLRAIQPAAEKKVAG